jgi:hypothetical protein
LANHSGYDVPFQFQLRIFLAFYSHFTVFMKSRAR